MDLLKQEYKLQTVGEQAYGFPRSGISVPIEVH
jgi:hypothetical protein